MTAGILFILIGSACSQQPDRGLTEYQGIVEFDERALSFEVPGKVQAVHVERGSTLMRYAVIARLDDTLERLDKASLEAEGRATNSELNLLYAGTRPEQIAQARAKLGAARSKLSFHEENFRRQSELWAKDAIPANELDASRALMQQAEADRDAAAQALAELRRGPRSQEIEAGEARLDAARTDVQAAEERIRRHVLYAEGPGEVLDVPVKRGEYVAAGTPVVTVADTTRPFVDVFVPQGQIGKFEVGAPVSLDVDTYGESFGGRVEYISQSTEFTPRFLFSPRERPNLVVRVRVRVHDPKRKLRAGIPAFADPGLAPAQSPPPLGSLLPPPSTSGLPLAPSEAPSAAPSGAPQSTPAPGGR